jgi:c-di-GMP-binding flagellar brake protein YcgR
MTTHSPTRKHKRQKVDIRIKLRVVGAGDADVFTVRSFEMSEGGMSVYSSETLELGLHLIAEFELPEVTAPLKMEAVVRNQRGFRCGLEFVDLSDEDRSKILLYLETLPGVIEI